MAVLNLTLKHGTTLEDARAKLAEAVQQVQSRFGAFVQRVGWTADRNAVKLAGTGFDVEMRVDPVELHVVGDIPFLGQLLAGPVMSGVQGILQQTFHKQLPKE